MYCTDCNVGFGTIDKFQHEIFISGETTRVTWNECLESKYGEKYKHNDTFSCGVYVECNSGWCSDVGRDEIVWYRFKVSTKYKASIY